MVSFDDFKKLDLRVGKIISAEPVPNSSKLLCLMINLNETESPANVATDNPAPSPAEMRKINRQILSGIAEFYQPEQLIGKNVVIIANLEPRMIMGLESQGMLLAADNGEPVILTPEKSVQPGAKIS